MESDGVMPKVFWRLARVVLLVVGFGVTSVMAAEPVPDEPFTQEYRDPFIQSESAAENDVRALAVDPEGTVWAATAAGLRLIEAGQFVEPPGEKIGGPAFDVAVDADGVIWIGAWNGLYRIANGQVVNDSLPEFVVTGVAPFNGRLMAAGTEGLFEKKEGTWQKVPGPWATSPLDLAVAEGDLYVAAWSGGYRVSGEKIERFSLPNQILSRNVRALAVDRNGKLWIGSRGGIDIYGSGRREGSITGKEGLPSTDVRSLAFDASGRLWVGTALGVARLDAKGWSLRHSLRWLPADEVRDVAFSQDGTAWVATKQGVSAIRKRKLTLADKADFYQKLVRARHVRAPGLVERCHLKTAGDLASYAATDTDNDGMYTGMYVAAEAFRYAVTGAEDAKANATESYRAMELLQTVTGTPGFIARTVVPPEWTQVADANRNHTAAEVADRLARDARWKYVPDRWRKSADGKWLWKRDTSSDETSGHFYAYAVYYDLVADEQEKKRVAAHVKRVIDHIIDGGYVFRDIDGKATRWAVWSPEKLNNDPNWWLERGGNSIEILSYLTVARHVTGDEKYEREIEKLLTEQGYAENILTPMQPGSDFFTYIGYQLLALSYPALLNYEKDPERRALYLKSMERWFAPVRRDASPLYAFTYANYSDGDFRQRECVELLRDIPLDMIQWTVNNSRREDVKLVQKPVEGHWQTDRLLPPSERSVFRWDRNVYTADRGAGGRSESSSVYWLLPYWMGRHYGYIDGPK